MKTPPQLYTKSDTERNPEARKLPPAVPHAFERFPFRQDVANLSRSSEFRLLENKTQLFPECESDLFRDRMTHSLEVAQIARDIATRINGIPPFSLPPQRGGVGNVSHDVVEFAALAHDIGHPPFGHTGERSLDMLMRPYGGFEGNAQTLRIVCRLIKLWYHGDPNHGGLFGSSGDLRLGLNLCYRTVLSILKYDEEIPLERAPESALHKGFYGTEAEVVRRAKDAVFGPGTWSLSEKTRTLECSIMDVADDIAYSTFDIQDAFRANVVRVSDFLYPRDFVLEAICSDLRRHDASRWTGKKDDLETHIRGSLQRFATGLREFVTIHWVASP